MNSSTKKNVMSKELFSYYSDIEHENYERVFRDMMNRMNLKKESCESS